MALGQPLNIAPVLRYTHLHSTQGRVHAHHMPGCVCMDTHTHTSTFKRKQMGNLSPIVLTLQRIKYVLV